VLVNDPLIGVPEPLAAIPVTVATLSLVQLKTVPGTVPVNAMLVIADPEQIVCEDGVAVAFGVGLTVIVKVFGVPVQAAGAPAKLTSSTYISVGSPALSPCTRNSILTV